MSPIPAVCFYEIYLIFFQFPFYFSFSEFYFFHCIHLFSQNVRNYGVNENKKYIFQILTHVF